MEFEDVVSYPKPAGNKAVPVWFGGESMAALRRVATYGDGWLGFNLMPDQTAERIKRIETLLQSNGRKRSDIHVAVSPYANPITGDDLKRYLDAGADEVVLLDLDMPSSKRGVIERLEQMAQEFVEPGARL